MSALGFNVSAFWAGLRARVLRVSDTSDQPPGPNGGCIRGFMWAMLFETVSVLALAGLIYVFHSARF